jgi:hypothetical protein
MAKQAHAHNTVMHACLIGCWTEFTARSQVTHMVLPLAVSCLLCLVTLWLHASLFTLRRCCAACCTPASGLVLRSSQRLWPVGTLPLPWLAVHA